MTKATPTTMQTFVSCFTLDFKIAAQMGDRYLDALKENDEVISECVTHNLLERHIKPLFV